VSKSLEVLDVIEITMTADMGHDLYEGVRKVLKGEKVELTVGQAEAITVLMKSLRAVRLQ
jgi:hypothetical protein